MSGSTTTEVPAATAWRAYQGISSEKIDESEMVEKYLPLVRNIVDRIKINLPPQVDVEDLYSVGVTGLIAAVRNFDPSQENTFAGYARTRIRGAVLDELRRLDWCPRRVRAKARLIKAAINEIEQATGRPATDEEVQGRLGVSGAKYQRWLEESRPVTFVALDQATTEEEGGSLHDAIADPNDVTGRDRIENEELVQLVTQRLAELPDQQKKILSMYYFEDMRLAEIAAVFGLTESRICQIHAQAVRSLRAYITRMRNR